MNVYQNVHQIADLSIFITSACMEVSLVGWTVYRASVCLDIDQQMETSFLSNDNLMRKQMNQFNNIILRSISILQ